MYKKSLYGYVIEAKKIRSWFDTDGVKHEDTYWILHYGNRIYSNKIAAQEAITHIRENSYWKTKEFRIKPLYQFIETNP